MKIIQMHRKILNISNTEDVPVLCTNDYLNDYNKRNENMNIYVMKRISFYQSSPYNRIYYLSIWYSAE